MAKKLRYECTKCHRKMAVNKDDAHRFLFVKKIEFRQFGFKGRLIRSRTVDWLCGNCMNADPDYTSIPESEVQDRMTR